MNTNINRTKPAKMQARGGSAQNQQNQNPNVGGASSSTATTSSNEVKANLDSVLEISMDKRNVKNNNRGGKRKRINQPGANQEIPANTATTSAL